MKQVIKKRPDIAFLVKMFPLPMHTGAYDKAKAILCSKSAKVLEEAHEGKPIPKADCAAPELDENIKLGQSLGIKATPTMVLPDGRVVAGALPADELIAQVDASAKLMKARGKQPGKD
jgi:thiol:disulfide interchange protein DsbC